MYQVENKLYCRNDWIYRGEINYSDWTWVAQIFSNGGLKKHRWLKKSTYSLFNLFKTSNRKSVEVAKIARKKIGQKIPSALPISSFSKLFYVSKFHKSRSALGFKKSIHVSKQLGIKYFSRLKLSCTSYSVFPQPSLINLVELGFYMRSLKLQRLVATWGNLTKKNGWVSTGDLARRKLRLNATKRYYRISNRMINIRLLFRWSSLNLCSSSVKKKGKNWLKKKYVYVRFFRKVFGLKRFYKQKRLISGSIPQSFKVDKLIERFSTRIDTFLVTRFGLKTIRHAKILILLGHVFLNGKKVKSTMAMVKKLDLVSFSKKTKKWFRLLFKRRRKLHKNRSNRGRKFNSGILFGPAKKLGIIWSLNRLDRKRGSFRRRKKMFLPQRSHIKFLLTSFAQG